MKKPRPAVRATVLADRGRLMAVGVFLFFVLGGILVPSAAKALPYEFSVSLDSTICGFQCTGTLFFTFDGTHVTFDADKFLNTQTTTPWNSYLLVPFSVSSAYINVYTPYHLEPNWIQYTRLQIYLESPSQYIWGNYTGPINPDPFDLFNLDIIEAVGGAGGAGYLEVGGIRTTHMAPQASSVPEPSSVLFLGFGLIVFAAWRRKQAQYLSHIA